MALPDGYAWREWTDDGLALTLGGRNIGLVVQLANSHRLVQRNVNTTHTATAFLPDQVRSIAFLEAWATRWDERIREQYSRLNPQLDTPPAPVPHDSYPHVPVPKRRRRR
ncbi:hypothetical protein LV507_08355 [Xanthomonas translucens]|uniref:hypothetical protein n=1 Tax=Xanthomonas campestris pv. translucens TaxID=343 RepID=UPI001F333943|nr:hypothetical protein [Xanthomonas translucens]UII65672.1 hypothetical protein LV507_08355 [Xanthomonas translucens]